VSALDDPSVAPQVSAVTEITGPTPSQTIGPFFRFGLDWLAAEDLVTPGSPGALTLAGRVLDGAGLGVPDAMVEIWQAGPDGAFGPAGGWNGFGRSLTGAEGDYRFTTVRPGPAEPGVAPHIDVTVFARGLLQRLVTRLYLPGEAANASDPLLLAVDEERRGTLVARSGPAALYFDIRLQGDRETVFFGW
jgi:protocatechuate 3,4-dioxygenase alpha subunit